MVDHTLFKKANRCRICGNRALTEVLNLGLQALSGRFLNTGARDVPRAPLVLVKCQQCHLLQLKHSVEPLELFTDGYGYRSGINNTMRNHLAGIVESVRTTVSLAPGDVVLDIGCNDGTLLRCYSDNGLIRVGIDPLANTFRACYPEHFVIRADFFSARVALSASGGRKAKVLTSIAVFYDLENPHAFVRDIKGILAPDGIWVLEQSYMPTMLEKNAYDTVCHEHLEYYGLKQIKYLTEAHELRVFDVHFSQINGGSFRVSVCHADGPYATNVSCIEGILRREAERGLDAVEIYEAFGRRVETLREQLVDFVTAECGRGKTIYLYGASTKGNTILQYCGLDTSLIVAAADRNSEKWGRRTPATNIPIISEEEARAAKPDYFLVLPWSFRDEFIARERAFSRQGGRFIFPLPEIEIV